MTKQYIAQEGQNIYDVCIHLYGTVDGMSILFELNKGLNLDALYVGQVIFYREENLAPNVQKAYSESGYIPATAGEMLDAPIPPPAPDPDAVVIQQYGLDDISIPAPGTYEVSPSVIVDEEGNVIQTLSPGEQYVDAVESVIIHLPSAPDVTVDAPGEYTVAPSTVSSGGSVIATLGPGENFDCPVQEVTIVYPNTDETIVEAPATFNVPASTVSKGGAVIASLSPGENFNCPIEIVTIKFPDDSQLEIEAPDTVIIPASTVELADGTVLAELSPGETYTIEETGIYYQRPPIMQKISYRTGDLGWHFQNGSFDYAVPSSALKLQELDLTVTNWFYTLKHNNAFGNKHRFTTSTGNPPASANPWAFVLSDFTADGALDWYVIDHLTGYGIYIANLGAVNQNWNAFIDEVVARNTAVFHGFNDWIPMFVGLCTLTVPEVVNYITSGSIFKGGVVSGTNEVDYMWLADTRPQNSTQAYVCGTNTRMSTINKSTITSSAQYMCRVHY